MVHKGLSKGSSVRNRGLRAQRGFYKGPVSQS